MKVSFKLVASPYGSPQATDVEITDAAPARAFQQSLMALQQAQQRMQQRIMSLHAAQRDAEELALREQAQREAATASGRNATPFWCGINVYAVGARR